MYEQVPMRAKFVPMSVELVDHMGSDLSVVNAARVSFEKVKDQFDERDDKLIDFLARNNHWSPFGHATMSLRIKAPIFVARQLVKHQVGLCWNEVSRRYVKSDPEFFDMREYRKSAENVKQGSSSDTMGYFMDHDYENVNLSIFDEYRIHCNRSLMYYKNMVAAGMCPELARTFLPLSSMTEWIWTGSVYAFARVCALRLDRHAQKETGYIAQGISQIAEELFPSSWNSLVVVENPWDEMEERFCVVGEQVHEKC